MRKNWVTEDMKAFVETAIAKFKTEMPSVMQPETIEIGTPGSDCDTQKIVVDFPGGEWVEVFGFDTEEGIEFPSESTVEFLCLCTSPGTSEGGIESSVKDVNMTAMAIKSALEYEGWEVVGSMDGFF